jgi:hypothetical protein
MLVAFLRTSGLSNELATLLLSKHSNSMQTIGKALDAITKIAPRYKPEDVDREMVPLLMKSGPGEIFALMLRSTMTKIPFINPFGVIHSLSKLENGIEITGTHAELNTSVGMVSLVSLKKLDSPYHHSIPVTVGEALTANKIPYYCPDGGILRVATLAFALYGRSQSKFIVFEASKISIPYATFDTAIKKGGNPYTVIDEFMKENADAIRKAFKAVRNTPLPDAWSPAEFLSSKLTLEHLTVSRTAEVDFPYTNVVNFIGGQALLAVTEESGKITPNIAKPPYLALKVDADAAKVDGLWARLPLGANSLLACDFFGSSSVWGCHLVAISIIYEFAFTKGATIVTDSITLVNGITHLNSVRQKSVKVLATVVKPGVTSVKWEKSMSECLFLCEVPVDEVKFTNCWFHLPAKASNIPINKVSYEKSDFCNMLKTQQVRGAMICPWTPKPSILIKFSGDTCNIEANSALIRKVMLYFNATSRAIFSTYMACLAQGEDAAVNCWIAPIDSSILAGAKALFKGMRVLSKEVIKQRSLETEYGSTTDAIAGLALEEINRKPTAPKVEEASKTAVPRSPKPSSREKGTKRRKQAKDNSTNFVENKSALPPPPAEEKPSADDKMEDGEADVDSFLGV